VRLITAQERDQLLAGCRAEAVHLEMRDSYSVDSEADEFATFLTTGRLPERAHTPEISRWLALIRGVTTSNRRVRRARIISEPVTDYIRYEWASTAVNIEAGEDVRWLPRQLASTIALPGNDFWLFDGETVVFSVFTGDGVIVERQLHTEPATAQPCRSAFEAVWAAAIPHSEYQPH
jgi:hypothetical protein